MIIMAKEIRFVMTDEAYHRMMVLKADRGTETVTEVIRDGLKMLKTAEDYKNRRGQLVINKDGIIYTFNVR